MDGLIEGRMVHFVIPDDASRSAGEHRAALVVRVWDKGAGSVNLHVFFDGSNDEAVDPQGDAWVTSVPYSEESKGRTWHWIERA
jgi:hypothetical protein